MTKAIIIARYKEKLDWINDPRLDGYEKFIYNKGQGNYGEKLPNKGREAHTYLHHIIKHYGQLHDVNLFTQANPFDHCPNFLEHVENIENPRFYDFELLNTRIKIHPDKITRMGAVIFDWVPAAFVNEMLDTVNPKIHQYYKRLGVPTILDVAHFGIFSVGREQIKRYKLDAYEKLLQHTINEEFGAWTLEMLWRTMYEEYVP